MNEPPLAHATIDLAQPLPAHVPPGLVRAFPFLRRGVTTASTTPWALFDEVIAEAPALFWAPHLSRDRDGWVLNSGQEIVRLLADTEHFSNKAKFSIRSVSRRSVLPVPSLSDPPDHGFYRGLVNPMFAPRRFSAMEQSIRETAREAVARIRGRGRCEFLKEFALEFPIRIFLMLMGLPHDMAGQFLEWEREIIRGKNPEAVAIAIEEICLYLDGEIAKRRARPRDDLISYGINAEFRGRRLDPEELLGYCFNLFAGGLDTVSASMSHQFIHLAQNPGDQALLRAEPERIGDAVDELARAYAVIIQMRDCIKPIAIGAQMILPGDRIAMPTQIANRDPALFERPGVVLLDRKAHNYTFGTGPHFCLGIHLARRELRIAIEEFLAGIPPFRIEGDAPIEYDLGGIIQPIAVPLCWHGTD